MSIGTSSLARWLSQQLTWRNTLRVCGLAGMMYQIFTKAHPDPTALLALGAMMGLPTFIGLQELSSRQKDEPKQSSSKRRPPSGEGS